MGDGVGAGIFRTPGLIAGYPTNAWTMLGVRVPGGGDDGVTTLVPAERAAAGAAARRSPGDGANGGTTLAADP